MVTGAQKIAETLIEAGIDHTFGVPGGAAGPVYDAFFDKGDKMKIVLTRHEQSASIMADVYGRLTGRPALLLGQGPFIGTSGGFGIMEAFLSYSPMLVITDTCDMGLWQLGPYQNVSGEYGTADLLSILRSMTKYTTMAVTPQEAVLGVLLAIKHATAGPPGPSAVLMRTGASSGQFEPDPRIPVRSAKTSLSNLEAVAPPGAIRKATDILKSAQHPVIIAGNGVRISKAYQELKDLAELLVAPVATTYKGRSAVEETHPLAIGPLGGYGLDTANRIVGEADVVLVVGSRLRAHDTAFYNRSVLDPERQRIIQIDLEPRNAGWTVPGELDLIGDAKVVLAQLLEDLRSRGFQSRDREERLMSLAQRKKALQYFDDSPSLYSDQSPILPQRLVRLIQETVDPSTIITLDAGNNRLWMHHFYQCQRTNTIFGPGGHGGMGWSVPAAVGAKVVHPERPVMAVAGDGGFMMTSNALSTAVQYGLPVVVVVFNDGALGMVRERQRSTGIIASEFVNTNHAKICEAYGGWGVQVDNPRDVPVAIRDAFNAKCPAVVDVLIDKYESFRQYQPKLSKGS